MRITLAALCTVRMKGVVAGAVWSVGLSCGTALYGGASTMELEIVSRYVSRGLMTADATTLHALLESSFEDFYVGVWTANPLANREPPENLSDEYDLYFGYGWALGSQSAIDAGLTVYHYPEAADSYEAYVGLYRQMGSFTPAIYIYRDFELRTTLGELSLTAVSPLPRWPIELEARLGRLVSDRDADYSYFEFDATYRLELNRKTTLSLGLGYSAHDLQGVGDRQSLVGSAAIRVGF